MDAYLPTMTRVPADPPTQGVNGIYAAAHTGRYTLLSLAGGVTNAYFPT